MELHDPAAVEPAKQKVSEIAHRLVTTDGGGLISIFYHPCEWIHLEFWDGVNFRRGTNPPPEQWKAPPQRTPAETEAAFERFGQYIDHIRAIPGIRFVTAGDLPLIYQDPLRSAGAPEADLTQLASNLATNGISAINFTQIGSRSYSPADQFELLAIAVGRLIAGQKPQFPLVAKGLLGPDNSAPGSNERTHIDWPAFRMAAVDVANFVETQGRVPSRVFIGPDAIPPAAFVVGLGRVFNYYQLHSSFPSDVGVDLPVNVELLPVRQVAEDTPGLFGGWIIHKENFQAPKVMEIARLQAWTLKPAARSKSE
jgi:hypothetical protein